VILLGSWESDDSMPSAIIVVIASWPISFVVANSKKGNAGGFIPNNLLRISALAL
jgi:hypothetical protein